MIVFLIIGLILIFIALFVLYKANNIKINKTNEQQKTQEKIKYLQHQKNQLVQQLQSTNQILDNKKKQLNNFYSIETEEIKKRIQDFKEVASQAANLYADNLQEVYSHAEARYEEKITRLEVDYSKTAASLQQLKETRKAAYEALLKEKEIKENKDNYRLLPSASDLDDIHSLEKIKRDLHKPRILSMLIWQTFWQPIAKKQFPIILQSKTKIGIYKITNIETDQSYIGQSNDVYKRWNDHCKAGLGIDTPVGNKLYKAIQEYGLQNFTFELLCECQKQQLNEKEKYFIELYQADTYGYNSTGGNK